jgi:hypothetical protein
MNDQTIKTVKLLTWEEALAGMDAIETVTAAREKAERAAKRKVKSGTYAKIAEVWGLETDGAALSVLKWADGTTGAIRASKDGKSFVLLALAGTRARVVKVSLTWIPPDGITSLAPTKRLNRPADH